MLRKLDEQPEITPEGEWFLEAFNRLSRDRSLGVSVGPIPWSSIVEYGERARLDVNNTERLQRLVCALDGEYLRAVAAEAEKKKPKGDA